MAGFDLMSSVIVHKRAVKYIRKLSGPQKERLKSSLKELENDPFQNQNVKQQLCKPATIDLKRV